MSKITNIISILSLILVVSLSVFIFSKYNSKNQKIEELKKEISSLEQENKSINDWKFDYYNAEAATLQSPHGLRLKLDNGDDTFILVDVRRQDFYEAGHIVTAVNITTDRDATQVYDDFKKIRDENPNKDIIIYCYSTSCLNGRKVGRFLAQNSIFVKELSIGFNEWKDQHEIWNYPGEVYNIDDYIIRGSQPGEYTSKTTNQNTVCGGEAFAC